MALDFNKIVIEYLEKDINSTIAYEDVTESAFYQFLKKQLDEYVEENQKKLLKIQNFTNAIKYLKENPLPINDKISEV